MPNQEEPRDLSDTLFSGDGLAVVEAILGETRDALAICDEQLSIIAGSSALGKLAGVDHALLAGHGLLSVLGCSPLAPDALASLKQGVTVELFDPSNTCRGTLSLRSVGPGEHGYWLAHVTPGTAASVHDAGAQLDPLTQLPNKFLFQDRIDQALIAAPRANKSVALVVLGVDRFAVINEGLGREVGDAVLKAVAERLGTTIRRSDTHARLDGDSFGLVMQISETRDSVLVAEKILDSLNASIDIEGTSVNVAVSIGISIFPDDSRDRDLLIQHAESAMRYLKKQGGNYFQFYSNDMNQRARERVEVEQNIRRALENDEFVVYYQPKVSLETNAVLGAEALVRWLDPNRGLIPPGEFIPVAEESGLIGEIGDVVLRSACQTNAEWLSQGLGPVRISVNVTASQFRDASLVARVREVLETSKLPHDLLELEITESMLIGDIEKVIERLAAFRVMGVHISIDDFGTGYSSLNYLSRFPVTTLKIDRAFVQDLESNPRTEEIVNAIIGLSRGLELEVVAEGAESIEHVQLLRDKGCDLVQGFFYSRPVPAEEFGQILKTGFLYDRPRET